MEHDKENSLERNSSSSGEKPLGKGDTSLQRTQVYSFQQEVREALKNSRKASNMGKSKEKRLVEADLQKEEPLEPLASSIEEDAKNLEEETEHREKLDAWQENIKKPEQVEDEKEFFQEMKDEQELGQMSSKQQQEKDKKRNWGGIGKNRKKSPKNKGEKSKEEQKIGQKQEEETVAKKKSINRQLTQITYIFVILFLALIGYLIKFTVFDREQVIENSHNKRQTTFSEKVLRGRIISSNNKVLAFSTENGDQSQSRQYPYGRMFSHVVGYDKKGRLGIEASYNYQLLTSNENLLLQITNALKGEKNNGDDLYTTLDTRLQKAAYEALGDRKGAIVAIEPSTGKILAMVSKPDFDPNEIESQWSSLNSSSNSILLNRATQGLYAPGSTFKILTALEYMRENKSYHNFHYRCNSVIEKNENKISCYHGIAHGDVNLQKAIAKSCNTAFVELGSDLNKGKLRQLADNLLFNTSIPIDISSKKSSFSLTGKTPDKSMPQLVIGQGNTLITPLNNALIMCAIANKGTIMQPYLVDHVQNYNGGVIKQYEAKKLQKAISEEEADKMKELLVSVVEEGTGTALKTSRYSVAGKTGSAEYNSNKDSHAWFVGLSNVENPDLVVSVLVEDGGSGGRTAAPIAKKIFDSYYNNELNH